MGLNPAGLRGDGLRRSGQRLGEVSQQLSSNCERRADRVQRLQRLQLSPGRRETRPVFQKRLFTVLQLHMKSTESPSVKCLVITKKRISVWKSSSLTNTARGVNIFLFTCRLQVGGACVLQPGHMRVFPLCDVVQIEI